MNNATLINQTSGCCEYFTPIEIIEAARATMGGIDLDPASSAAANERVKAARFYAEHENGLRQPWRITEAERGRIWLNHPFGRISNPLWIRRLVTEYECGQISQACCITFACTSEVWFRPLLAFPQCFLHGRTNYVLPSGDVLKGVTKGSVVTYLGYSVTKFHRCFSPLGTVKIVL